MANLVWSECGKVERTLAEWGTVKRVILALWTNIRRPTKGKICAQEVELGVKKRLKQNSGQQRNIHLFPNLNQEVQVKGVAILFFVLLLYVYDFDGFMP